ncbi:MULTISPECIES: hypothetical protein [unclassified Ensifer]|uniref:hypothetical protein n=1 Tax=unclassified Ensifer TaxID=2633371 RepID=UPI0012E3F6F8|nr:MULTISPECIES: hypothetical protein [unclassified Ensifer]
MEQKVESAEAILKEIRDVEERISLIITEQMLNRGGHRYVGGFGEEAEFAIYRVLQNSKSVRQKRSMDTNLEELHRDLGFQLCNAIFGTKWHEETAAARSWLCSSGFQLLPDEPKLKELAMADGVDLSKVSDVFDAYIKFRDENIIPSGDVVKRLYGYKNVTEQSDQ